MRRCKTTVPPKFDRERAPIEAVSAAFAWD